MISSSILEECWHRGEGMAGKMAGVLGVEEYLGAIAER